MYVYINSRIIVAFLSNVADKSRKENVENGCIHLH